MILLKTLNQQSKLYNFKSRHNAFVRKKKTLLIIKSKSVRGLIWGLFMGNGLK